MSNKYQEVINKYRSMDDSDTSRYVTNKTFAEELAYAEKPYRDKAAELRKPLLAELQAEADQYFDEEMHEVPKEAMRTDAADALGKLATEVTDDEVKQFHFDALYRSREATNDEIGELELDANSAIDDVMADRRARQYQAQQDADLLPNRGR